MHPSFKLLSNNVAFDFFCSPCSFPFINEIQSTNIYIYLFGFGAGGDFWFY